MSAQEEIAGEWKQRAEQFEKLFSRMDGTDNQDSDDANEELQELPLGVTEYKMARIDLSTGGPGDWLEALYHEDDLQRITYHFAPWFDHAELDVTKDPEAVRFVEYFYYA